MSLSWPDVVCHGQQFRIGLLVLIWCICFRIQSMTALAQAQERLVGEFAIDLPYPIYYPDSQRFPTIREVQQALAPSEPRLLLLVGLADSKEKCQLPTYSADGLTLGWQQTAASRQQSQLFLWSVNQSQPISIPNPTMPFQAALTFRQQQSGPLLYSASSPDWNQVGLYLTWEPRGPQPLLVPPALELTRSRFLTSAPDLLHYTHMTDLLGLPDHENYSIVSVPALDEARTTPPVLTNQITISGAVAGHLAPDGQRLLYYKQTTTVAQPAGWYVLHWPSKQAQRLPAPEHFLWRGALWNATGSAIAGYRRPTTAAAEPRWQLAVWQLADDPMARSANGPAQELASVPLNPDWEGRGPTWDAAGLGLWAVVADFQQGRDDTELLWINQQRQHYTFSLSALGTVTPDLASHPKTTILPELALVLKTQQQYRVCLAFLSTPEPVAK